MTARYATHLKVALLGLAFGLLPVFFGIVGCIIHIDTPAGRRLAARTLSSSLSTLFAGRLEFETIESISPFGVTAVNVKVYDPAAQEVLSVSELRAKLDLFELGKKLLSSNDKLTLTVPFVRVESATVWVKQDSKTKQITLEQTFTVVREPDVAPSTRPVRVWLPTIEVGLAHGHADLTGLPKLEAAVKSVRGSLLATQKGAAIDISQFATMLRGLGPADARGVGSLHIRAPGAIWGSFDGHFGGVQIGASVRVDKDKVSLRADSPQAQPSSLRDLIPGWPVQRPVSLHAEATGTLDRLRLEGNLASGKSRVDFRGQLRTVDHLTAKLDVNGQAIDLSALWPSLPASEIDTQAQIWVRNHGGDTVLDFNGNTSPSSWGGIRIPSARINGTYNPLGLVAKAEVEEPGAPLSVQLNVHPDGAIDVAAQAKRFDVRAAPRLEPFLAGTRGNLAFQLAAHIEQERVDANLTASLIEAKVGAFSLRAGTFSGTLSGPLQHTDELQISGRLRGSDLHAGPLTFNTLDLKAQGGMDRVRAQASVQSNRGPRITASAELSTPRAERLENVNVSVENERTKIEGKIRALEIADKRLIVDRLLLAGAGGTLALDLDYRPLSTKIHAQAAGFDLNRFSRALGFSSGDLAGKLDLDLAAAVSSQAQQAHLKLAANGVKLPGLAALAGIDANIEATLDGTKLSGSGDAAVTGLGSAQARFDTQLAGDARMKDAYLNATGRVELSVEQVPLKKAHELLGNPLSQTDIAGTAALHMRLERRTPAYPPEVTFTADAKELQLTHRPISPESKALELSGLTVELAGSLQTPSGEVNLSGRVLDAAGTLAAMSTTSQIDVEEMWSSTQKWQDFLARPVHAVLSLQERPLSTLPEAIRPKLRGFVSGQLVVTGALKQPVLFAKASIRQLSGDNTGLRLPIDVQASARYDVSTAEYAGRAEADARGRHLLALDFIGQEPSQQLMRSANPARARATLSFEGFPLDLLEPLADANAKGDAFGTLMLAKSESGSRLQADLRLRRVSIDGVNIGEGTLAGALKGNVLRGKLTLAGARGQLDSSVEAKLLWDGLFPEPDLKQAMTLTVVLDRFDAIVLSPMLRDIVSDLSGEVSGELLARIKQTSDSHDPAHPEWRGILDGHASLRRGAFELSALGTKLEDVSMTCIAVPYGRGNRLSIRPVDAKSGAGFTAKIRSDRDNLWVIGDLYLDGLQLTQAQLNLTGQSIPILSDGVTLANVTTGGGENSTKIVFKREPDEVRVTFDIPELVAELPRVSGRELIELGPNPNIHVKQPLGPREKARDEDALPYRITFDLGPRVRLTQASMDLPLSGSPTLHINGKTRMSGDVSLKPGGRVQILGKNFVVEHGLVEFTTGESDNPRLDVGAGWRSPEGTKVLLLVRGTLKSPSFQWRLDPPIATDEVSNEQMAKNLLLGGSTGSTAATTAASQVADAFNEILAGTRFQLRATSEGSGARIPGTSYGDETETEGSFATIGASVKISDKVYVSGAYKREQSGLQSDADIEQGVSTTLEYRFRPDWSLRTEVGQLGAGMDLLWQYRY